MLKDEQQNTNYNETKKAWKLLGLALIILLVGSLIYGFLIAYKNSFLNNKKDTIKSREYDITKEIGESYPTKNPLPRVDQEELKTNYKIAIDSIKSEFLNIKIQDNLDKTKDWAIFSHSALEKIFEIIVPAESKEFHLALAINLNNINKLTTSDKVDSEKLKEEVDALYNLLEN